MGAHMDYKINWSDEFITDIKEIDEQHKEIINKVNALYQAIEEQANKETIIGLIEDLDFYTTTHFETEEKHMLIHEFDRHLSHEKAHNFFKLTYEELRYNFYYIDDKDSPNYKFTYIFALHLCQILIDWLNLHLNTYDKAFAEYLRKNTQK